MKVEDEMNVFDMEDVNCLKHFVEKISHISVDVGM